MHSADRTRSREHWNKVQFVGQKAPLHVNDIGAIRVRPKIQRRTRGLALFDSGVDSKLRGCDAARAPRSLFTKPRAPDSWLAHIPAEPRDRFTDRQSARQGRHKTPNRR